MSKDQGMESIQDTCTGSLDCYALPLLKIKWGETLKRLKLVNNVVTWCALPNGLWKQYLEKIWVIS